jgi:hypothetical protein
MGMYWFGNGRSSHACVAKKLTVRANLAGAGSSPPPPPDVGLLWLCGTVRKKLRASSLLRSVTCRRRPSRSSQCAPQ